MSGPVFPKASRTLQFPTILSITVMGCVFCIAAMLIPAAKFVIRCSSPGFRVSYSGGLSGSFKGSGDADSSSSAPYHRILLRASDTAAVTIVVPLDASPGTYPFVASNDLGQGYQISARVNTSSTKFDYSDLVSGSLTLKSMPTHIGGFYVIRGSFEATFSDGAGQLTTFQGTFNFGACEWTPCQCES
jgi:hypothetical protein